MSCKRCASNKLKDVNGKVATHFPGREGLTKPLVWVCPRLLVCLDCGFSEFTIPKRELDVLATGSPTEGVVVAQAREKIS